MRVLTAWIAILLMALPWPSVAADNKIRVRVVDFAPNYFLQDGHWVGLDVELAEAVVKEAGLEVEFMELPWSRALAYMQTGEVDLMANLSRSADREAFIYFFGPERTSKRVLVVRKENVGLKINTLDDLVTAAKQAKLPFGIQKDAKYSDVFDARLIAEPAFASAFEAVVVGPQLPKKVAGGRNLGFFEDENYVAYQIKKSPDFESLVTHPFTLSNEPVYFGVSRKVDPVTIASLEGAFKRLEKSGKLAKIRQAWGRGDK